MPDLRFVAVVILAALPCFGPARAESRVVGHHGVWDVSCAAADTPSSPPSGCKLLLDLGGGPDLRSVAVDRRADGRVFARLTFLAGIFLPRGVDIAFDGERKGTLAFERCLPDDGGCIAEFDATQLLGRLKAGGAMALASSPDPKSESGATVTIDGFAEALAELAALAPPPAGAKDAATSVTYGAWQLFCREGAAGPGERRCNVIQSARDTKEGNLLSAVFVPRTGRPPLMHVSVAGTVLIRPGLALAIDGAPQGVVQFDACGQIGCTVQVELADIVAARFKAGKTATFTYKVQPDQTIAVPLALDGFGASLAALADGG